MQLLKMRPEADNDFELRLRQMIQALNFKTKDKFIEAKKMEPRTWVNDERSKKHQSLTRKA